MSAAHYHGYLLNLAANVSLYIKLSMYHSLFSGQDPFRNWQQPPNVVTTLYPPHFNQMMLPQHFTCRVPAGHIVIGFLWAQKQYPSRHPML